MLVTNSKNKPGIYFSRHTIYSINLPATQSYPFQTMLFILLRMKSNKQLKEEYKQKKFKVGVFQVRNTVNNKIFVGSSVNLDAIWNRIKAELRFEGHRNLLLQKEWMEFGEHNFSFEILSEIEQTDNEKLDYKKQAGKLEEMFIEELQPFAEKGYHTIKAATTTG